MPTSNFCQPHNRTIQYVPAKVTPGPGDYKTNHGEDTRLRNIEITSSFQKHTTRLPEDSTPGPGDYDNRRIEVLQERRPAYSMRLRLKKDVHLKDVQDNVSTYPGPADYSDLTTPDAVVQSAPYMQPVPREEQYVKKSYKPPTPGPADYLQEHAKDKTHVRNPTYKLGLKKVTGGPKDLGTDSPGPKYMMTSHIGKGMAKSISAKDLVISDRNFKKPSTTPGPGKYHKLSHSTSEPIINRAPAYTWAAKRHTHGHSGAERSVAQVIGPEKVGPGTYEAFPDWTHKTAPSYSMSVRAKKNGWEVPVSSTPGPNYNPVEKRTKEYTMQGKNDYKERTAQKLRNPGPGDYEFEEAWEAAKTIKPYDRKAGYSMRKKLPKKERNDARIHGLTHDDPKPNASKSWKAPAYSMPGRNRQKQDAAKQTPGPANYNIRPVQFTQQKVVRLC